MNQQALVNGYFESSADFWREIYEHTDVTSRVYQTRFHTVLDQVDRLRLPADSRVLEVGCGAGHTTVALAQRGFLVDALDAAQAMASQTGTLVEQFGLSQRVSTGTGDIYHLPYPDASFPLALAIGVLPWLADRDRAVNELARIIAPGGYLLITMDNSRSLARWLDPSVNPLLLPTKRRAARLFGSATPRAQFSSNASIDRTLVRHGLRKRWSSTVGFGPFTFFNRPILPARTAVHVHERLQTIAFQQSSWLRNAGSHYLVLAQKTPTTERIA